MILLQPESFLTLFIGGFKIEDTVSEIDEDCVDDTYDFFCFVCFAPLCMLRPFWDVVSYLHISHLKSLAGRKTRALNICIS